MFNLGGENRRTIKGHSLSDVSVFPDELLEYENTPLHSLLQNSPSPLMLSTEGDEVLFVNQAWIELTGYDQTQIKTVNEWRERVFGERGKEGRHLITTKEGDQKVCEIQSKPLGADTKGRGLIATYLTDFTEEHRLKRKAETNDSSLLHILDQLPAILWTVDKEMRVTSSLGLGLKGIGYASHELLGTSLYDYHHTNDPHHPEIQRHQRAMQGEMLSFEVEHEGRILATQMGPLRDDKGNSIGCIGICLDVSDTRRLGLELAAKNKILEMIATGHALNEIFTELILSLQTLRPGMLGSILLLDEQNGTLHSVAAPSLPDGYNKVIEGIKIGPEVGSCGTAAYHAKTVIVENIEEDPLWKNYLSLAKEYDLKACWSHPILSKEKKVLGTFAMYFKTPQKPETEDLVLMDSAANLAAIAIERDSSRRNTQRLVTNLQRSNKDLELFASIASHDLREPLRMVSCYLDLVRNTLGAKMGPEIDTYISYAVSGASRMKNLIDGLMWYSRVGGKPQEIATVDLNILLHNVVESLDVSIRESKAVVKWAGLPTIKGDAVLLFQLFQNLISNAIRYRGKRTAEISITAKHLKNEWLFTVEDNGIGIPNADLERIFTPFQRSSNTPDNTRLGVGLGLAICKRAVERHGGWISAESEVGKGTTFSIVIPDNLDT